MRQVVLKLSRLLELKRIFGLCTFAKIALLETLLEEFVIAFCQKLSRWNFLWNHEELGWRRWFHEFLSGVGKDDFLSWRTRWMSISLTLLASLNPQIIRRADTWQLIKTWAQIFSDKEMDERNNAARRRAYQRSHFSWTIFQNDTDKKVVRYTTWWNPVTIRSHFSTK